MFVNYFTKSQLYGSRWLKTEAPSREPFTFAGAEPARPSRWHLYEPLNANERSEGREEGAKLRLRPLAWIFHHPESHTRLYVPNGVLIDFPGRTNISTQPPKGCVDLPLKYCAVPYTEQIDFDTA